MRFGCCVNTEQLPMVKTVGFDFAELPVAAVAPEAPDAAWKSVRDQILDCGVPILGFNVLLPKYLHVVGHAVDEGELAEYLDIVFPRMSSLGAKYLSFGSGGSRSLPEGFDEQTGEEQLKRFITMLGHKAAEHGITVHIEFLNRKETNLIVNALEAEKYVQSANLPSVKLLFDLYHAMEESEPLEDLLQVAASLGYVHVADTDRRYPGSGHYPYLEFARLLRTCQYDGPISVECRWGDDMEFEMKQSLVYLKTIFDPA
ncbi:sugar phosphate isomerase/epimerase family protein [Alicyclobacillus acidiphilus]|uniref:sugar phosphate isomerase/epimerase family protein n=1 Tax=Alicyclobacillus acidiphilus TaxID=182455 RepID=UPI00082D1ABF|nr:sugar phosphate isomerase/epimerase [Alicyclobacillus acidiphilus]